MQNINIIFFIGLFISSLTFAQNNPFSNTSITSKQLFKGLNNEKIHTLCQNAEKGGTELVRNCARYEWENVDKELNNIYMKILKNKKLDDSTSTMKASPSLINSQKYWIIYRNEFCNTLYYSLGGIDAGTGIPSEYMDCMIDLGKERLKQLQIYFP